MASKNLQLSVVMRAVNHLTGPLRTAMRGIQDVDRAAKQSEGLRALSRQLNSVGEGMQKLGGLTLGGGVGAAAALGLTSVPREAAAAEHSLRQIGNVAGLTNRQLSEANRSLLRLSVETNQYQTALIGGLDVLTSKGLAYSAAMAALPAIGKTATAQVADVEALSRSGFAFIQNLKVLPEELAAAFNVAATAGQEGAFELKHMAQHLDSLAAKAAPLGIRGLTGVGQIGSSLQVALLGAGDPAKAANNFENFLSKITAPETVKHFAKFGVDLQSEFKRASTSADPLLHMLRLIQRTTKGDQFKMGELFGDMQVLDFLRPMLANMERYVEIRDKAAAGGASGALINDNFARMMGTTQEQGKLLLINMRAIAGTEVDGPLARFNALLKRVNGDPVLQSWIFKATLGMVGLGAATLVAGTALKVLSPLVRGAGLAWQGAGGFAAGLAGAGAGEEASRRRRIVMGAGQRIGSLPSRFGTANAALRTGISRAGYAAWWQGAMLRRQGVRGVARAGVARAGGSRMAGALRSLTTLRLPVGTWAGAGSRLVGIFRLITVSARGLSLTLLANPLGLAIAGVAVGAILLYKHWRPVSSFFKGVWRGIKEGVGPIMPEIRELGRAVAPLVGWVKPLVGWFGRLVSPVQSTGAAADRMGVKFGKVIGWLLKWTVLLPVRFATLGANMISSLAQGITSKWGELKGSVTGMLTRVMRFFPQSPAKEGPLSNLHRLKWGETIAMGINAAPMVSAMRSATLATLAAATLTGAGSRPPLLTPLRPVASLGEVASAGAAAGGSAGSSLPPVQIVQTFHIGAGASADVVEGVRTAAREGADEGFRRAVLQIIKEQTSNNLRKSFRE